MIQYSRNDSIKFTFKQIVCEGELYVDYDKSDVVKEVIINGFSGILIEYPSNPKIYLLVWRDMNYEYSIQGYFDNEYEIINIAKGVTINIE